MLLVGWQEGHPACKKWVVGCWHGYLSVARCRFAYGPADTSATHYLLLQEIQTGFGFTFLVPAHPGSPRQTRESWNSCSSSSRVKTRKSVWRKLYSLYFVVWEVTRWVMRKLRVEEWLVSTVMSMYTHMHRHTHTHTTILQLSGLCPAQPGKPFWILLKQEISKGWQWHQLDHMQIICTTLQTDNYASTPSLNFFMGRMLFLTPNQLCQSTKGNVKALKAQIENDTLIILSER